MVLVVLVVLVILVVLHCRADTATAIATNHLLPLSLTLLQLQPPPPQLPPSLLSPWHWQLLWGPGGAGGTGGTGGTGGAVGASWLVVWWSGGLVVCGLVVWWSGGMVGWRWYWLRLWCAGGGCGTGAGVRLMLLLLLVVLVISLVVVDVVAAALSLVMMVPPLLLRMVVVVMVDVVASALPCVVFGAVSRALKLSLALVAPVVLYYCVGTTTIRAPNSYFATASDVATDTTTISADAAVATNSLPLATSLAQCWC